MPRIDVPGDRDPMIYLWTERAPRLAGAAARFGNTVYYSSTLSPREFEVVRMRIAQINGCRVCQGFRATRDVVDRFDDASVPEELYEHVGDPGWPGFSERERLAIEFTERFALDHLSMADDEAFWGRLHEHFTDDELVELACCAGAHLVNGRINRVFDVEGDCSIRPVVRLPDATSTVSAVPGGGA
jgi:alkylhydroperoxidase family enzyme